MYELYFSKRVLKQIKELPDFIVKLQFRVSGGSNNPQLAAIKFQSLLLGFIPVIQKKLAVLMDDLRDKGPIRAGWPNYSKLEKKIYHCHLVMKWVVCWQCENKSIIIEVYYAGSRENAPY